MGRPLSEDLRDRLIKAVQAENLSCRSVAKRFQVGISTAIRWVGRHLATGSAAPFAMGGKKPRALSGAHRDWLIARCKDADFTLRGLVAELAARGVKTSCRAVGVFLREERISFKKNIRGRGTGPARHCPQTGAMAAVAKTDRPVPARVSG